MLEAFESSSKTGSFSFVFLLNGEKSVQMHNWLDCYIDFLSNWEYKKNQKT